MHRAGFADYVGAYGGQAAQAEFERWIDRAAAYVDVLTAGRAAAAAGYKLERVKLAECAAVDELRAQAASHGAQGERVSSVNNEGFSVRYGEAGYGGERAALRGAVLSALSGTGLAGAV